VMWYWAKENKEGQLHLSALSPCKGSDKMCCNNFPIFEYRYSPILKDN